MMDIQVEPPMTMKNESLNPFPTPVVPVPKAIVQELDKYIIGQKDAKKAVAIALRNRWRRQQVSEDLRDEITPKNIIMMGPTGCGKTEIARRLARIMRAPFIKVEATKYTEVGYIGKDVEGMIRDLVEFSVNLVKSEARQKVMKKAKENATQRVLDLLIPPPPRNGTVPLKSVDPSTDSPSSNTREKFRLLLEDGQLSDRIVIIDIHDSPQIAGIEIMGPGGMEEMQMNLKNMFKNMMPQKRRRKKVKVSEALEMLTKEEASKLIDMDAVHKEAVNRAENHGIVFIDEFDKIAGTDTGRGPDVSRGGVQRDLLPIVEGSNINTKYGLVKTDHMLFIASGAFHYNKPSDLIPELQGRFPIRVELATLIESDFYDILTKTENSLIKQYEELLKSDNITLSFSDEAIRAICNIAVKINEQNENIGARRLHTVLEKVLEEISYEAPFENEDSPQIEINRDYVTARIAPILKDQDLSKYIL
jgi:ATP-dependent HslUV protease ATP-binding subunit HslU